MPRISLRLKLAGAALGIALSASNLSAQRVVASYDEWLTGACCLGSNEQQFISNSLNWFGASSGGNALIYSGNGFLNNATFISYLQGKGFTVTVDANAASFAGYNVVFGGGNQTQNAAGLVSYVQGGGNVFYVGGTGTGGPAGEAAYSNPFLNSFGLTFASTYSLSNTYVNTSGYAAQGPFGSALFTGVSQIYADYGNSISATAPVSGWTSQVWIDGSGTGTYGAASAVSVVPEPSTYVLMFGGLLATIPFARRRKHR